MNKSILFIWVSYGDLPGLTKEGEIMGTMSARQTMTLAPILQAALWPELQLAPELQQELAQWEKDMANWNAMLPSKLKGKVKKNECIKANKLLGSFVQAAQVGEVSDLVTNVLNTQDLSGFIFRSIGLGRGDDVEGPLTARRLHGLRPVFSDWATSALDNGLAAIKSSLRRSPIPGIKARDLFERFELGQAVGLTSPMASFGTHSSQMSEGAAKRTLIVSLSRVAQHMPVEQLVPVLWGLGRILYLNPNARIILVHPYPEDALNQPVEEKYVTAFPYTLKFFLQHISEGAQTDCVELRRAQHNYLDWQLYTASTVGLAAQ